MSTPKILPHRREALKTRVAGATGRMMAAADAAKDGRRYVDPKDLVTGNLDLVEILAHKLDGPDVEIDDLRSAGQLAICRAANKYDPAGGASFRTYATHWVRGAMLDIIKVAKDRRLHEIAMEGMFGYAELPYDPQEMVLPSEGYTVVAEALANRETVTREQYLAAMEKGRGQMGRRDVGYLEVEYSGAKSQT